jgi:5-methyltetrahydrofolate--homocysteine methyltransferase
MESLLEYVRRGGILIADGAMGTQLMERGLKPNECPESLNLSNPDVLEEIATAYLDAGAEIIQTNTFGGSPLKLEPYGLREKTEEINRRAVEAVRRVVGDSVYISGSCGPCGQLLIPYGDTAPELVYEGALRQMRALIDAGVDVICVETMTDITEAALNIRAARAISPDIPIMATMTFDRTPKGFFTIMGVTVQNAADELSRAGADIIGSNCGHGIELMIKIAKEFKIRTRLPLIIQSNAGLPEIVDGVLSYPESPDFMAEKARDLVDIGVSIIGGCCGTTPEHIQALRRMRDSLTE